MTVKTEDGVRTVEGQDRCPGCLREVDSEYRKAGVLAPCENDDCRVDRFEPWVSDDE